MPTHTEKLVAETVYNLKDAPFSLADGDDFSIQNIGNFPVYYAELASAPADLGTTPRHEVPADVPGEYPWATGTIGSDGMYMWCLASTLVSITV